MEYCRTILLLALASLCAGLEVKILDSTKRIENPGMTMELSCHLNQSLSVILSHTIQWVHMSLSDQDERKQTVLSTQQTLTDKASPDDYSINVDYNDTRCLFTLVVKRVRSQDDGIFLCRVTENEGGETIDKDVHVIVVNNVEQIAMQFDGEESIMGEDRAGLQREEGRYGVTCTARGFNPAASIHIFLGDEEQETGGTQIDMDSAASKSAGARRYSASATAMDVHLKAQHSGRRLKCMARADFDGASTMVASVPLSIIVLEPVVSCDKNVSAKPGDLYVKIKCRVKHVNIPIDRYAWEISSTGETIEKDDENKNYHEILVQDLGNHVTLVTLDLYQVDESHFATVYYLDIFTSSGQKFRAEAELIRVGPEPGSSATKTSAALVVLLLSAMLSFFGCL